MTLTTYVVGQPFPEEKYCPKNQDACRLMINDGLFDIVFSLNRLSQREIQIMRSGNLKYGVFVREEVPFFMVKLTLDEGEVMVYEFSLNAHAIKPEYRDEWLVDDANAISFFIIESSTGILQGMRMIGIDYEVAREMKRMAARQLIEYKDYKEVDAKINEIQNQYDPEDMLRLTKLTPHVMIN